ncbi:hypothetical protein ACFO5X_06350 [Seohaeicola nanhaiensis]|uniref:Uncharacterized protein n=1 Tax=Seohaeicola nanhaiensis TaxID=1387282 RepID=A0ABV9KE14_9RHOB
MSAPKDRGTIRVPLGASNYSPETAKKRYRIERLEGDILNVFQRLEDLEKDMAHAQTLLHQRDNDGAEDEPGDIDRLIARHGINTILRRYVDRNCDPGKIQVFAVTPAFNRVDHSEEVAF